MQARKNTVSLYSQDGMLRICFRYQGTQIRKALGLPDQSIHRVKAEQIGSTIELAILSDSFDLNSLDGYVFNKPKETLPAKKIYKKYGKDSPKRQPFSKAEIDLILNAVYSDQFTNRKSAFRDSHYATYFHALFLFGCRISELIGLR